MCMFVQVSWYVFSMCFAGDNKDEAVAKALKECFSCVMNCDSEVVKNQLKSLFERLDDSHLNRQDTTPYLGRLFIRIYREFPGDVGCFVIYFLNHVILEPGEAVYLAPNIPHAYLYGGKFVFHMDIDLSYWFFPSCSDVS